MKSAVIVFPGSNCDRDCADSLERVTGQRPTLVWHQETDLPRLDLIVLPGGFSYGDYLRCGAMAAQSPVMREVKARAETGVAVLGICNGFQILTEAHLLPGALVRNANLKYVCREQPLEITNPDTRFTRAYGSISQTVMPIGHGEGNYTTDAETLARLEGDGRVAFRYRGNPNGSVNDIAGILNEAGNVLGLMPHPDRSADPHLDRMGGWKLFESILEST
jgi:phosphoribosylformylglycinamidine synthase I